MGLLSEIIEGARGSAVSTTELLRSVRVLAVRGKAHDLGNWVKRELAGYPRGEPLPRYRGPFDAQVLGRFSGPMGRETTIAIPDLGFPEDFGPLFKIELRGPLSELEGMLDADFDKQIGFAWPANAVAWANQLMDQGKVAHVEFHGLRSAHRPLTKNLLLTAINGVRDRILDLALELEQVSPDLENIESSQTVVQPEKMSAVYQVVVHADNAFVGENTTQFQHLQITPGDPTSLDRYLEGLGIGDPALRQELVQQAEEAKAEGIDDTAGPVKTAFESTIDAVAKAVPNVAVALIEAAVRKWIAGGA